MKRLFLLLLTLASFSLSAQTTVFDNNPPRIRWYQLNTKDIRILFPEGFDEQAQRMANTLQHIHQPEAETMGKEPRKISVILQNQSSVSNGFVSMIPRRSEFYTMPSQNYNFSGTLDWLNMLASHEYRHVVQYQQANRGFNRALLYLFGYPTFTAMTQVAAPRWFFEGDAVATETAFSASGRGRIPNFALAFRTNLMEGRVFNYQKQYLTSYKHFIPDHYVLGYHMISYLRRRTNDPDIWEKITARTFNVPFIPFRYSSAIKAESGLYVNQLYREMAKDLAAEWKAVDATLELTPFERVNVRRGKAYTDYLYPQIMADGSVVAMMKGIGEIEKFVTITDRNKKIFTPGIYNQTGMLSASGLSVVWNEYGYSPRWGVRNFSRIKVYDKSARKLRIIGDKRGRYAGAALSPDGSKIVTVESDIDYKVALIILDVKSGKILSKLPNEQGYFYSMARWSPEGDKIVTLRTSKEGRAVIVIDPSSGRSEVVISPTDENIGHPVLAGKYLLFNSPITGIDNIFAIDRTSGQRYQVTSSKYGAYNPAVTPDGKTMYYNDQTKNGLDVVKTMFNPAAWTAGEPVFRDNTLAANLSAQEGRQHIFDSVPNVKYDVKKYSRWKGIINPTSWGFFTDNTFAQAEFGISSRDLLSTTSISLGVNYDINERNFSRKAAISYQGWFPIVDFQYLAGDRKVKDNIQDKELVTEWKESAVEAGFRIPLVLTKSKYHRNISVGNYVGITKVNEFRNTITGNNAQEIINDRFIPFETDTTAGPDVNIGTLYFIDRAKIGNGTLVFNRFFISGYNLLKRSHRDFLYRWGQTIDFEWYDTPYGKNYRGQLYAVRATAYFPGLFKHHFLYFRGGYQSSFQGNFADLDVYTFRNRIAKPRGFSYPNDRTFSAISVNYAFPLWYPDVHVGPILNIQRIKLNCFFDYGQGAGTQYYYTQDFLAPQAKIFRGITDRSYQSIGVETTFDFNVLRYLPQFELGFRTTYRAANPAQNSGVLVEFLIGNIGF